MLKKLIKLDITRLISMFSVVLNSRKSNFYYIYKIFRGIFIHCVKIVQIQSFSGPYFPVFGFKTEKKLRIIIVFLSLEN